MNIPKDESIETVLFSEIAKKISIIDTATDNQIDEMISNEEAGAHIFATAQLCDDKNNITKSEFNGAEFAIRYNDYKLEEIMADYGCSKEIATKILKYVKNYNKNLEFASEHFVTPNKTE